MSSPDSGALQPGANHPTGVGPSTHLHRSSRADQRVWLERLPHEAATMDLHSYCLDCGAIRSQLSAHGRSIGFFHNAIANLKAILDHHPSLPKLAQVHSHLIAKALESIPDFGDPYSMSFETQWTIFHSIVTRYRPDLDDEVVERALPRPPRRLKPAFINLLPLSAKGGQLTAAGPLR